MSEFKIIKAMDQLNEAYIEEANPQNAQSIKGTRKKLLIRYISAIACLCIISAFALSFILKANLQNTYYYTANDIATLFHESTECYGSVLLPKTYEKDLDTITFNKHITTYKYKNFSKELSASEFFDFTDKIISRLTEIDEEIYPQIKENNNRLAMSHSFEEYRITASQYFSFNQFDIKPPDTDDTTDELLIDDIKVTVDTRASDDEILSSLEEVKEKLFYIFGTEFSDAKVIKKYRGYDHEYTTTRIYVIFYNEDDHPLNKLLSATSASDFIRIEFYQSEFPGETDIYQTASIYYRQNRNDPYDCYSSNNAVKMISLDEAEEFLFRGYAFRKSNHALSGGVNGDTDFRSYDFVEIKYISGSYPLNKKDYSTDIVPFYVFYKITENYDDEYNKLEVAYVPAIEVKDYEKYFENSKTSN